MNGHSRVRDVGAVDPELPNSPIAAEFDEESDTVLQQNPGEPVCLFNGREYGNDEYVRSGSRLLKCRYGVWVEVES